MKNIKDIKPTTPVVNFNRKSFEETEKKYKIDLVAPIVGMSPSFIKKVVGNGTKLNAISILKLLDQDSFNETFVPRSKVLAYLDKISVAQGDKLIKIKESPTFLCGDALEIIPTLPNDFIQCVVTSTPYWGMRLYDTMHSIGWADGEYCAFGMEQTPEGFIRHSVQILFELLPKIKISGSVWWNIGDTFNTRTQIRNNAVDALKAMQGKEKLRWTEHACRRYSAGHSFLKDGEQCLIPFKIADRASRIGYFNKTMISWVKTSSMPEPQNSRVSRNIEYIIHLSKQRTPSFNKEIYKVVPPSLGGKNNGFESDKLSDSWILPTSAGGNGHGAQFPLALPGRSIALSSIKNDWVLDPFAGIGTSGMAAKALDRKFIGIDVSSKYLDIAKDRIHAINPMAEILV